MFGPMCFAKFASLGKCHKMTGEGLIKARTDKAHVIDERNRIAAMVPIIMLARMWVDRVSPLIGDGNIRIPIVSSKSSTGERVPGFPVRESHRFSLR